MKKLASLIARSRVEPRRKGKTTRPGDEKGLSDPARAPGPPTNGSSDVRAALDSWDLRYQPAPDQTHEEPTLERTARGFSTRKPRATRETQTEVQEKGPEIPTVKVRTRDKKRGNSLSMSVSEEEAQLLRTHAAKLGLGFSEWSRKTLFRSMGRKVPSRPKRD
jgi:hypothetical protein